VVLLLTLLLLDLLEKQRPLLCQLPPQLLQLLRTMSPFSFSCCCASYCCCYCSCCSYSTMHMQAYC
jgi:hypothetical protein